MNSGLTPPDAGLVESAEEVLENAPCGFATALPDGTIIKVNAKLVEWTGLPRSRLLGGMRVPDLLTRAGQIYYETHLRPLLLMQGEVREIACQLAGGDRPPRHVFFNAGVKRDPDGKVELVRVTFFDATERMKYESELRWRRQQAEQLGAIVTASGDAITSVGLDLVVRSWNAGATALFGYSEAEAVGQTVDALIVPEDRRGERADLYDMVRNGETAVLLETERRHKDGRLIPVELRASPIHDGGGQVVAVSVIHRDITERRRAEQHVRLIMRELGHRTKNLMGVIMAIARQSARGGDVEAFLRGFTQRLKSLAASQDLLVDGDWRGVDLETLVRTQLAPFGGDSATAIALDGDPVRLAPRAAEALGMAMHELATNAAKYGAFRDDGGRVEISWTTACGGRPEFSMRWRETGGPAVVPPTRTGFGRVVTEKMVAAAIGGTVSSEFPPGGLVWSVAAPLDRVVEGDTETDAAGPGIGLPAP